METVVDVAAAIVFLLFIPSVAWAVRKESGEDAPAALAVFVSFFVILMGIVFISAASNLATGQSVTKFVMLFFYIVMAILARVVSTSKPAA